MPTQILLNPIGSGGDVFPFLAIGRELQRRGHHVAVMTNPMFIERVGQAGLEFIEIGTKDALRAVGADPKLHSSRHAWKLALKWGAVGTMRQTFEVIRERIKKCDTMLVAPSIGLGARVAAEFLSVPLATVVLSPFVIRSSHQCPLIKPMVLADWVPGISKRVQFWIADRCFIDPVLNPDIAAFRQELGLPPRSRYLHRWCFSDDLTIALFPEFFATPQPDWPGSARQTGPVYWDPPVDTKVADSLDQFIASDRKPIVVLAGSAGPESSGFIENWVAATKRLNRQMILLEKNCSLIPAALPKHVFHATYFPIGDLARRSAVVAHAGGVGTTLRCMLAGVPQIVFPKVNDQPDNANRIQRLGVGRVMRATKWNVDQIAAALSDVMGDQTIANHCADLSHSFPNQDPTQTTCDVIEATFAAQKK